MLRRFLLAALGTAALAVPAIAQQPPDAPAAVAVRDAWARATPSGASTGAAYLTLTSPAGDVLVGASSPAAAQASVHEMRMDGDIMRMRAVEEGLPLPAGQPVTLRPGGYHVMLERLAGPLKQGQSVSVRLLFRNAPPVDLQVPVQAVGAAGPGGAHAGHDAMPGTAHGTAPGVTPGTTMGK